MNTDELPESLREVLKGRFIPVRNKASSIGALN